MTLPVREMVLYKHGVGFFARQGQVSGESVSLIFKQDEINDVLKSLAVFDRAGGQILGIHYQTPKDHARQLNESSINLSANASLYDLIRDLRGRRVTFTLVNDENEQTVLTGRVIGIDVQDNVRERHRLSLLDEDGSVHIFSSEDLTKLIIEDDQSSRDLSFFLDTSLTEENRRTINLRLSEGEHDLVVYYVAPSPTWRVSYRFVAETDEDGTTGKAVLQGWGLFDNRLDEDLINVNVTLVAGQPISFIYDLYSSQIPTRIMINDHSDRDQYAMPIEETGVAPRILKRMRRTGMESVGDAEDMVNRGSDAMLAIRGFGDPVTLSDLKKSLESFANVQDTNELFQYQVTTPVTVKRGESALVPIISEEVRYERELLYNESKLKDHPVAALRFVNSTSLTLERGPVTVIEDGDYKGEAIFDFTKPDNLVYLPYAVELGVKVIEKHQNATQISGLNVNGKYVIFDEYYIEEITTLFENTTNHQVVVTLESPLLPNFELFDTPLPESETMTEHRWKVNVPAHGRAEFVRKVRRLNRRNQEIRKLEYRELEKFMSNRWLDEASLARLENILQLVGSVRQANELIVRQNGERQDIYNRQSQLRENLTALNASESDAAFRSRLLKQLEDSQDQLDTVEGEIAVLKAQVETSEAQIESLLRELN